MVSPLKDTTIPPSDPHLLIPKLLYFWLNMLVYASYTFTADYLLQVYQFPLYAFGYLSSVCLISFGGALGWTMIADRRGVRKRMLMGAVVVYASTFCLLKFGSIFLFPNNNNDNSHDGLAWTKTLYVLVIFALSNFGISVMYPLLDSQIFQLLRHRGDHLLFGRQRMWGTIGQGVITIVNGVGIGRLGWDAVFGSVVGCSFVFLMIVLFGLTADEKVNDREGKEVDDGTLEQNQKDSPSSASSLWSPSFIFFLFTVLVVGFGRAVLGNYLPTYLRQALGQSPLMVGLVLSCRIIPELAVFTFNSQLITLVGVGGMFVIGQATSALRALLYSFLSKDTTWSFVPFVIEILKGINNGMMVSAGVHLTDQLTPLAKRSTAQGLFSGIHGSVANALSGVVSGNVLYMRSGKGGDQSGALKELFRWTSYALLGTLFVYCVVERRLILKREINR